MTISNEQIQAEKVSKKLTRRINDAYGFQRTSNGKHALIYLSISECRDVLSLLAEREADKTLIAELKDALDKSQSQSSKWLEGYHKAASIGARYEERIAELEDRTVKLPKPHAHLIWIQAGYPPDDYWDDVAVSHSVKDRCCDGSERYLVYSIFEIQEACAAAGITLVVEE